MPRLASDRRPLYLGWLLGVQSREVSGDAVEPEVPSGLGELDEAFSALVEFLEIDMDRVAAAAKNSRPADPAALGRDAARWISSLRPDERDDLLVRLISGDGHLVLELRQRVAQAAERASFHEPRRRAVELLACSQVLRRERVAAEKGEDERRWRTDEKVAGASNAPAGLETPCKTQGWHEASI